MIVERHQDYQLTIENLPAGGLKDVPLPLDSDAPFALRLVRSRNIGPSGWRFQTPRRQWQSSGLRTDVIINRLISPFPAAGWYPSRGVVIYPEMIYPVNSTIVCDIGNDTGERIVNARLLFRGSKLFDSAAVNPATYPDKFSPLPFVYSTVVTLPALTGKVPDVQLRVKNDADFTLRYAMADPFGLRVDGQATSYLMVNPPKFTELYGQLRDESRKAFSNEPIHLDDLFGEMSPQNAGAGGNNNRFAWIPNCFSPEIYVRRDSSLYLDLYRFDTAAGGTVPCDVHIRWCGLKVFNR